MNHIQAASASAARPDAPIISDISHLGGRGALYLLALVQAQRLRRHVAPTPEATAETPSVSQSTEVPAQTPVQSVNVRMQVPQNLQYGDEITLTATMTGFENTNYAVRWQFTRDGQTWQDADGSGADSTTFRFAVSDQNVGTGWRLAVTTW